jgi:hypothetical protein
VEQEDAEMPAQEEAASSNWRFVFDSPTNPFFFFVFPCDDPDKTRCHLIFVLVFVSALVVFFLSRQHAMKKEASENQARFKAALGTDVNFGDYVEVQHCN